MHFCSQYVPNLYVTSHANIKDTYLQFVVYTVYTLPQVCTRPDMTSDVVRTQNNKHKMLLAFSSSLTHCHSHYSAVAFIELNLIIGVLNDNCEEGTSSVMSSENNYRLQPAILLV